MSAEAKLELEIVSIDEETVKFVELLENFGLSVDTINVILGKLNRT